VVSGALAGLLSALVVLYQFLTRPRLRVYPNPLLVRQTIADLMLACVVVALYMPRSKGTMGRYKGGAAQALGAAALSLLLYLRELRWFSIAALFVGILGWLNNGTYGGGADDVLSSLMPRSCLVPSTVVLVFLHMSLWRLPLISVDLYRTMTNPFLEFTKAVHQYDVVLCAYLIVVGAAFVGLDKAVPGVGLSATALASNAGKGVSCPLLRNSDTDPTCYGMAGAWVFGDEDASASKQPKICFVPNRDPDTPAQSVYAYLYPMAWLYIEIVASTLTTMAMAYFAYRRLVSGTSEVRREQLPQGWKIFHPGRLVLPL
jgi:hypothetical protein